MITTRQEYQFVTGDIGLVEIDGGIMPLRSGDAAKSLRGEDVCFLMEGVNERRRAVEGGASTYASSFARTLSAAQLEPLRNYFVSSVGGGERLLPRGVWIKDGATFPAASRNDDASYDAAFLAAYDNAGGARYFQPSDFSGYGWSFQGGDDIVASRVRGLFADMALVRRFIRPVTPVVVNSAPLSGTELHYGEHGDPAEPERFATSLTFTGRVATFPGTSQPMATLTGVVLCAGVVNFNLLIPDPSATASAFAFVPVPATGVADIGQLAADCYSITGIPASSAGDIYPSGVYAGAAYGIYELTDHTLW